jgi:hypothetical protein
VFMGCAENPTLSAITSLSPSGVRKRTHFLTTNSRFFPRLSNSHGGLMSVWKYVKVEGVWRYKAAIEDKGKLLPNMVRVNGKWSFTRKALTTSAAVGNG